MSDTSPGLTIRTKLSVRPASTPPRPPTSRPVGEPDDADDDVPHEARLLALAIVFEDMVRTGMVESYAEIAAHLELSRARVSQIMDLLEVPPDRQKALMVHT